MESSARSRRDSLHKAFQGEALPAEFQFDAIFVAASRSAHRSRSCLRRHPSTMPSRDMLRDRSHFQFLVLENVRNLSRTVRPGRTWPTACCAPVRHPILLSPRRLGASPSRSVRSLLLSRRPLVRGESRTPCPVPYGRFPSLREDRADPLRRLAPPASDFSGLRRHLRSL